MKRRRCWRGAIHVVIIIVGVTASVRGARVGRTEVAHVGSRTKAAAAAVVVVAADGGGVPTAHVLIVRTRRGGALCGDGGAKMDDSRSASLANAIVPLSPPVAARVVRRGVGFVVDLVPAVRRVLLAPDVVTL